MKKDFKADIENSLEALLKLENDASKKKKLFDKDKNICLKISLFRIPKMKGIRKKYLSLRHSRFGEDPEVCLFVPNRKSNFQYKVSTDDSIDFTIDYFQNFLEKHKVEGIKAIIPLKQLECEYGAYELRRKLVNRFDLFLCEISLLHNPRFISALGKYFIKKNKEPLGIYFPAFNGPFDENFNKNIKRAIFSSLFKIKPFSDNYAIPIGKLYQSKEELAENLDTVIEQLSNSDIIPGGFCNVRGLYLGTSSVGAIPLYISLDFPENLKTPIVKGRIKSIKPVEGEISTLLGKKVLVKPNGDVIVKQMKNYNKFNDSHQEEECESELTDIEDGSDVEEENEREIVRFGEESGNKNTRDASLNSDSSESEEDDEIEKREMRLLRQSELFKKEIRKTKREEMDEKHADRPVKKMRKMRKMSKIEKKTTPKNKTAKLKKAKKITKVS